MQDNIFPHCDSDSGKPKGRCRKARAQALGTARAKTPALKERSSRPIKIRTTSHTPLSCRPKCVDRVGPASPFRADPGSHAAHPRLAPWAFLLHPCGCRVKRIPLAEIGWDSLPEACLRHGQAVS